MSKVFFDTNLLVYCFDEKDPGKRDHCRFLLGKARAGAVKGVLSTQVLQEFCVTGVKKLGMAPSFARDVLDSLDGFEVVSISPSLIREALDCQQSSRLSFWDALIIVAAASARCETIWSEDFNAGQAIRGVRVENPLRELRAR